jgi:hypothetical protein
MTAQTLVYALCFLTSVLCAGLLVRAYVRTRTRLLLWCALSFVFLAINNMFVLVDIYWPPDGNMRPMRLGASLAAVAVLIYGFIWEVE